MKGIILGIIAIVVLSFGVYYQYREQVDRSKKKNNDIN